MDGVAAAAGSMGHQRDVQGGTLWTCATCGIGGEGRSQRAVAREFGISRDMVGKMLRYAAPPGYQRQQAVKRPRLGPWLGVIDAILENDKR